MAKFEYTIKLNGRKYYPGEEVPLETPKAETVAEKAAVDEQPINDNVNEETENVSVTKSKGKKKKSS